MTNSVRARWAKGGAFASPVPGFTVPLLKVTMTAVGCLALANCSSSSFTAGERTKDPKYGVYASPRLVAGADPIDPGVSRRGVYLVGRPYVVAGKRYVPHEDTNYSAVGTASWYGNDFHGRLTANGEVFDMHDVTAAHKTMPLPSYARVTNLENGDSIIVRVNDRGPYHGGRVIDVSRRAAELLEFKQQGTGRVKVEYVGRAKPTGSDTAMLVASLRTDGSPAQLNLGGVPDTMVAQVPAVAPVPAAPAPAPVLLAAYQAPAQPAVASAEALPPAIAEPERLAAETMAYQSGVLPLPPERPAEISVASVVVPANATVTPENAAAAAPATPGVAAPAAVTIGAPVNADAGSIDLLTIPGAATPIPAKAKPTQILHKLPQHTADAGARLIRTVPMKLRVADIVGTAATLGDTPMVLPVLAYAAAAPQPSPDIYVNAGLYADQAGAERMRWVLSQAGEVQVLSYERGGHTVWQVQAGPFADRTEAAAVVGMARSAGADGAALAE